MNFYNRYFKSKIITSVLPLILFLIYCIQLSSQKELNNWIFPNYKLNFNNPDVAITIKDYKTYFRGSSSMSNKDGQLLFYVNGAHAWNKNGEYLTNGKNLVDTTDVPFTSKAIILQNNEFDTLYNVFITNPYNGQSNSGLYFGKISMSKNGIDGEVIEPFIKIENNTTQQICAIHPQCTDYDWLAIVSNVEKQIKIYKVGLNGVNLNAVMQINNTNAISSSFFGQMKFSPDGTKLAYCNYSGGVFLYDFNIESGSLSNQIYIPDESIIQNGYIALEFSPNSRFLYTFGLTNLPHSIYQYDLRNYNSSSIISSKTIIGFAEQFGHREMMLAPNGKIYFSFGGGFGHRVLSVINNPNIKGIDCDYSHLSFETGAEQNIFLPISVTNESREVDFEKIDLCGNGHLKFQTTLFSRYDSLKWKINGVFYSDKKEFDYHLNHSDSITVKLTTFLCNSIQSVEKKYNVIAKPIISDTIHVSICEDELYEGYSIPGIYLDTFKTNLNCDSTRIIKLVVHPKEEQILNLKLCNGQTFEKYKSSGIYVDTIQTKNGCIQKRFINLTILPLNLYKDSVEICKGEKYLGYNVTGTYQNIYKDSNGCDSTYILYLKVNDVYSLRISDTICNGDSVIFYNKVLFDTGIYSYIKPNFNDCDSIIELSLSVLEDHFLGEDITLTSNQIFIKSKYDATSWFDNTIGPEIKIDKPGVYWASFTIDNCTIYDTIIVYRENKIFFPNIIKLSSQQNSSFAPTFNFDVNLLEFYQIMIFDRYGNRVFYSTDSLIPWNGYFNNRSVEMGVYTSLIRYKVKNENIKIIKGDITVVK
jgi:hypothetical protein